MVSRPLPLEWREGLPFSSRGTSSQAFVSRAPGDVLQLYYHLWLVKDGLFGSTPLFWDPYQFRVDGPRWNLPQTFLPLSLPFTALSALGSAAAYNVLVFLSFPLSGLAAYSLARRYTESTISAVVTGIAFALAPARLGPLFGGHASGFAAVFVPLVLRGLDVALVDGRLRGGLMGGGALLALAMLDPHYAYIMGGVALAYVPLRWSAMTPPRRISLGAAGHVRAPGGGRRGLALHAESGVSPGFGCVSGPEPRRGPPPVTRPGEPALARDIRGLLRAAPGRGRFLGPCPRPPGQGARLLRGRVRRRPGAQSRSDHALLPAVQPPARRGTALQFHPEPGEVPYSDESRRDDARRVRDRRPARKATGPRPAPGSSPPPHRRPLGDAALASDHRDAVSRQPDLRRGQCRFAEGVVPPDLGRRQRLVRRLSLRQHAHPCPDAERLLADGRAPLRDRGVRAAPGIERRPPGADQVHAALRRLGVTHVVVDRALSRRT